MAVWHDVAMTTSERVKAVDTWWKTEAASGLPERSAFDPTQFPNELPFLLVVELRPTFRLYYRLVGTKVVGVSGLDFTGKHLDELIFTGDHEPWTDRYRDACDRKLPVYGRCMIDLLSGGELHYEYGIWPLATGGTEVRQFLALEDYASHHSKSQPVLIQGTVRPRLVAATSLST